MRIRNLSAYEKIFQESSKIYKDALKNSGFREEFTYQEENIPNDIKENKKYSKKKQKTSRAQSAGTVEYTDFISSEGLDPTSTNVRYMKKKTIW